MSDSVWMERQSRQQQSQKSSTVYVRPRHHHRLDWRELCIVHHHQSLLKIFTY